ncbi:DNA helicase/exodeoxyribonuclease V subunit A [Hoeflea halophila]|uniref:DNA 3'-5' helicase n=1 Tax=Hoeflea halophila TaxID=714899 RepID=A0A286IBH5_9HYPH|nr:double-strand break repair helicase AddA [Hoeflea halophila]SOE16996.1 DNA helicase/exodeoxyribonuclease V subunit A [Hoeflea halophila]
MTEQTSQAIISDTTLRQNRAATPTLSAWVSANAGSGKTHVLARRVIRLLLRGARPSAILCLTYTKAASAEMSNRIFKTLGEWVRLDDAALAERITELEGRPAEPHQLVRARRLFATALETPGGLKIQTIHAFCEAVLHRFPLEANIPGHFNVLDDQKAAELLAEARRHLMSSQSFENHPELARAVTEALDVGGEAGFDKLISGLYARRREYIAFDAMAKTATGAEALIRQALGLAPEDNETALVKTSWPLEALPVEYLRAVHEFAESAKSASKAYNFSFGLLTAGSEPDPDTRLDLLRQVFFTKSGAPAKLGTVASKSVLERFPDLTDRVAAAQEQIIAVFDKLARLHMLSASVTVFHLARRYLGEFERLKTRQALLDYDDLIGATEALLSKSGASAWVHYKLDQGIDHVLVDEAQDTAPLQWNVIGALSDEFFAGEGARPATRTLFAVGDEKQSIYSFQGARPERFAEERGRIAKLAKAMDAEFEQVSLRVSFRSSTEVLKLVDHVFASADALRGIGSADEPVIHETVRLQAPGLVEIWPMIAREQTGDEDDWTAAFDEVPESAPAAQLARRIADVLRHWVGKEMIEDQKSRKIRPVAPGDVLVLVRKRDGFVPTLLRTLKATTDIPVAGADRLRLTDHIAVQDLIALGRFVLLSDDDLSLAALFKSPLLGLDEDDLFLLTSQRPDGMSVWRRLRDLAETDPRFETAVAKLKRWSSRAAQLPPHDFFASLLGPDGGRRAYLARLGHEVGDVLDEFLGLTLDHEQAGLPGLQSFLAMLETDTPEIKREMEGQSGAVRIMTVHAAKGLEAPIVFLVDSGGEAFQHSHQPRLLLLPPRPGSDEPPSVPVWLPDKGHENEAIAPVREKMREQAEEEYRRLLYVGLTRAADRLVVCGYRGIREVRTPTWHSLASAGLERAADGEPDYTVSDVVYQAVTEPFEARRFCRTRVAEPVATSRGPQASAFAATTPVSGIHIPAAPLPPPARLPRPLAPSGVSAVLEDSAELATRSPFAGGHAGSTAALERGSMIHRLLHVLPGVPAAERQAVLTRYLARALPGEQEESRQIIESQVLSVLQDPAFAPIFDAPGEAEVSVMGTLRVAGEERAVSGRIDRIALDGDRVLIVDYKTGLAPQPGEQPPSGHVSQLAIYRALLSPLYPGRRIDAALVYVSGPQLIEIPGPVLDQALSGLDA